MSDGEHTFQVLSAAQLQGERTAVTPTLQSNRGPLAYSANEMADEVLCCISRNLNCHQR